MLTGAGRKFRPRRTGRGSADGTARRAGPYGAAVPHEHTARTHRSEVHISTPRRRQRRALSRHDSDTRALLAARSSNVLRRRVSDDQGGRGWRASLRDMRCSESTVCMPCAVCPAASTAPCACRSRPCAPRRACRPGKLRRTSPTGCPRATPTARSCTTRARCPAASPCPANTPARARRALALHVRGVPHMHVLAIATRIDAARGGRR